jgi:outer membrane protein
MSDNKGSKILIGVLGILVLGSLGFTWWDHATRPKTAFIIVGEVFNQFDMKKDSEKKFTQVKNKRQRITDSLALELRILAKKIDADKAKNKEDVTSYNRKREEYYNKQKTFEEDNKQLTSQYDGEIFTQLNQYVKDFGKENGYLYVFGSDGNGSLMYAEDANNQTKQVIEYINRRYKGVK